MPDDQYPTGSPQSPESAHFADSQPQDVEPEISFEPLAVPAPDDLSDQPADVAGLGGGQYPDDMFGLGDAADDAAVMLPGDAIAGGLADVAYGDPSETPLPLPPPAEPQVLADISIDPLPAPGAEAPAGDMFSVDDFADEPVAPAAPGGDMFSVDDLMDEQSAPLATPPEPLAAPEPLATPEPLSMPEPLAAPAPLDMPDPPVAPEPLAVPEPLAMPEPLAAPEPLATPEPLAMPEPLAAPEPPAMPEPVAEVEFAPTESETVVGPYGITENQAEMGGSSFGFTAGDAAPEPFIADPPVEPAADEPVFQPMTEPVVEPLADQTGLGEAAEPSFEPLAMPQPPIDAEPEIELPAADEPVFESPAKPEQLDVVNPYATVSDEAEVLDPSMSFETPEAELPTTGEAPTVVNPYAVVSDEAEVLDPSMSFKDVEPMESEAAPEVFERSDPDAIYADAAAASNVDPFASQVAGGTTAFDAAMPAAYGESNYGDVPASSLPETSRTVSVAPPGMEGMAVGGLVVAGSKRNGGSRGKNKKRSAGKGKRGKKGAELAMAEQMQIDPNQAYAAPQAYADPNQAYAAPQAYVDPNQAHADLQAYADPVAAYPDPTVGAPEAPIDPYAVTAADPYALPTTSTPAAYPDSHPQPIGAPAFPSPPAVPPPGIEQSHEGGKAKKPKKGKTKKAKAPKQPKAAKAPKAAKQGPSLADKLLGPVEPGQRHKIFGLSIGKATPLPGEIEAANQAVAEPLASQPSPMPAPMPMPEQAAPPVFAPAPVPAPYGEAPVPYGETPASVAPEQAEFVGAEVINTVEATAHARGKKGKTKKTKAPKQPKAAKSPKAAKAPKAAKQGPSLADKLLGPVEPGQRHKIFGLSIGKATPLPGEAQAMPEAAPAPPFAPEQAMPVAPAPEFAPPPPLPPEFAPPAPPVEQAVPQYASEPVAPSAPAQIEAAPAFSPPAPPVAAPVEQPPAVLEPAAAAPMTQPDIPDTPQTAAYPPPTQQPAMPVAPPAPTPAQTSPPDGSAPAAHGQSAPFFPGGYAADFPGQSSPAQATMAPGGAAAATAMAMPQTVAEPMATAYASAPQPVSGPQSAAAVPPVDAAPEPENSAFKLAETRPRVMATLVDVSLIGVLWMLIGKFAGYGVLATAADGSPAGYPPIALGILALVVILYQGGMLAYNNGQTLGKSLAKIRLVREDGEPIDLGFAVLRRLVAKSRVIDAS